MKKLAIISAILLAGVAGAFADTYTYTITVTNAQAIAYSDALPVSGWLDKIEVAVEAASTTTVTVATYSGTTAVDTYATKAINGTSIGTVFRPRLIGTDNAAAALAGVVGAGPAGTNAYSTVLNALYERPMLGGNVKVAVTGTANDGSCPVTVTIFYEPVAH